MFEKPQPFFHQTIGWMQRAFWNNLTFLIKLKLPYIMGFNVCIDPELQTILRRFRLHIYILNEHISLNIKYCSSIMLIATPLSLPLPFSYLFFISRIHFPICLATLLTHSNLSISQSTSDLHALMNALNLHLQDNG